MPKKDEYVKDSWTLSNFALAELKDGNIKRALQTAEKISDDFERLQTLKHIVEMQIKAGDLKNAIKISREVKVVSHRSFLLIRIAETQAELGDAKKAEQILDQAIQSAKKIDTVANRSQVLCDIAEAQFKIYNTEKAEQILDQAVQIAKKINRKAQRLRMLDYIAEVQAKAGNRFVKGNIQKTKINTVDKTAREWFDKGFALSKFGRYSEARDCYDKALEINPKDVESWNGKGLVLHKLCKYEGAVECYEKCLEINPEYENALNNKKKAMAKLEELEKEHKLKLEAEMILKEAERHMVNKNFGEAINSFEKSVGMFDIGFNKSHIIKGKIEKAGKLKFETEKQEAVILKKAEQLLANKKFDEALNTLEKSLKIFKENGLNAKSINDEIKHVNKIKNEMAKQEAEQIFKEAERHFVNKNFDEAIKQFEKSLKIFESIGLNATNIRTKIKQANKLIFETEKQEALILKKTDQFLADNKFDEALIALKKSLKSFEGNGLNTKVINEKIKQVNNLKNEIAKQEIECILKEAEQYLADENFDKAITTFEKSLEMSDNLGLNAILIRDKMEQVNCLKEKDGSATIVGTREHEMQLSQQTLIPENEQNLKDDLTEYYKEEIVEIESSNQFDIDLSDIISVELPEKLDYEKPCVIKFTANNLFEMNLNKLMLDFSTSKPYFDIPDIIEFPPLQPGISLNKYIEIKPLYEGVLKLEMNIKSNQMQSKKIFEINCIRNQPEPHVNQNIEQKRSSSKGVLKLISENNNLISIKRGFSHRDGRFIWFKTKVENNSQYPIRDVKVHLSLPPTLHCEFPKSPELTIGDIESGETLACEFRLKPTACTKSMVNGYVVYKGISGELQTFIMRGKEIETCHPNLEHLPQSFADVAKTISSKDLHKDSEHIRLEGIGLVDTTNLLIKTAEWMNMYHVEDNGHEGQLIFVGRQKVEQTMVIARATVREDCIKVKCYVEREEVMVGFLVEFIEYLEELIASSVKPSKDLIYRLQDHFDNINDSLAFDPSKATIFTQLNKVHEICRCVDKNISKEIAGFVDEVQKFSESEEKLDEATIISLKRYIDSWNEVMRRKI